MSKHRRPPSGSTPAPPRRARVRSHPGDGSLLQDPVLSAALLQAIPDLIFVIGRDGTYLDYYARDLSGLLLPPDQFLGKKMREITAIREAGEHRQELAGRLIAAHESERARVAQTLDDQVGQSIANIAVE